MHAVTSGIELPQPFGQKNCIIVYIQNVVYWENRFVALGPGCSGMIIQAMNSFLFQKFPKEFNWPLIFDYELRATLVLEDNDPKHNRSPLLNELIQIKLLVH